MHLQIDLSEVIDWADSQSLRWAFTLSNAGSYYFESRCDRDDLNELNWDHINDDWWGVSGADSAIKEAKQAEFLVEKKVPWELVEAIGIYPDVGLNTRLAKTLKDLEHRPGVSFQNDWYYPS